MSVRAKREQADKKSWMNPFDALADVVRHRDRNSRAYSVLSKRDRRLHLYDALQDSEKDQNREFHAVSTPLSGLT